MSERPGPQSAQLPESSYPIPAENIAEMKRLTKQAQLATSFTGLLPAALRDFAPQKLLDIASGPGEWVLSAAEAYPHSLVTGVDISEIMLEYSRFCAEERAIYNTSFFHMDARQPLDFPAGSFDLVHSRAVIGFLTLESWPRYVAEAFRLLRPGGFFCSMEFENVITTSPSLTRYFSLMVEAMRRTGHCYTPEGDFFGVIAMQERLFSDAGFQDIQHEAHIINFARERPEHPIVAEDWRTLMKLLQPFMVHLGLGSQEDLEVLYNRALSELDDDDFCGLLLYQRVWGTKPG